MSDETIDRFVEAWGSMGTFWGISHSVARVHALLIISDRVWTLDEICERLRISRGNASMSLKELRGWGVVRRERRPGDRREFYASEADSWQMLFRILRERKRREFDPILASVRDTRERAEADPAGIELARLRQLDEMLGSFDRLAERALAGGERMKALVAFLIGKA